MPSITAAFATLKPGPCAHCPRQPIADPTAQMLAFSLVLIALFPLLAPPDGQTLRPQARQLECKIILFDFFSCN